MPKEQMTKEKLEQYDKDIDYLKKFLGNNFMQSQFWKSFTHDELMNAARLHREQNKYTRSLEKMYNT